MGKVPGLLCQEKFYIQFVYYVDSEKKNGTIMENQYHQCLVARKAVLVSTEHGCIIVSSQKFCLSAGNSLFRRIQATS
jgi:hypothetical protein